MPVSQRTELIGKVAMRHGIIAAEALKQAVENVDTSAKALYTDSSKDTAEDLRQIKTSMLYFRVLGAGIVAINPGNERMMDTLFEWGSKCDDVISQKPPQKKMVARILNLGKGDIKDLIR